MKTEGLAMKFFGYNEMEWAAELEIWIDFQGLDFKSNAFKYFQTKIWTKFKIEKIQVAFWELFKSEILGFGLNIQI
jgi:hypothetical protein